MQKRIPFNVLVILGIFTLILVLAAPEAAFPESTSVDISRMATVTEKQENGQNSVIIVVDEKEVLNLIDNQSGIEELSYEIEGKYAQISLEFTHKMFNALGSRKITMLVKSDLGKSVFRPEQVGFGALGQRNIDSQEVTVRLTIGKAPADQCLRVERVIQGHGMTGVLNPVVFRTEALAGEQVLELQINKDYVTQKLILSREVDPKHAIGVILNTNGDLVPVPTRFLKEDGKDIALVKSKEFGTFTVVERTVEFSDARTHWAEDDIGVLASKMIVNGVSKDLFAPDDQVTRAQIAAMLVRSLGLGQASSSVQLNDVKESAWYYRNVASVVDCEIMRGYPGRVFRPDAIIAREEAAVLASQVLAFSGEEGNLDSADIDRILSNFKDRDNISPWARPGVAVAVKTGILKGAVGGNIKPLDKCTRAEFAVLLRRVLVNAGLISPSVILESPADNLYTNKDTLNVRGKAKPGNTLNICGEQTATTQDGTFDTSLNLLLGANTISFEDEDLFGNTEIIFRKVVYDNVSPVLRITYPNDKVIVTGLQMTVEGSIEEGCSVKINDTDANVSGGSFRAVIPLKLGRNILGITAADRAGNKTFTNRVVYCSPNKISSFTVSPDPIKLGLRVNIRYMMEQDAYVTLEVFRENGEKIKTVQDRVFETSGTRSGQWDGTDVSGTLVPDGRYRFVGIVKDSNGEELARTEKTVNAARVPQVSSDMDDLPVFAPGENQGITIPYTIQSDSIVTVKILKGHFAIKTLVEDLYVRPGNHSIIWDGNDSTGSFAEDGSYSCVISAVSAQVEKFKANSEFRFVIEREPPRITNFMASPDPIKLNVMPLNIRYRLSETAKVTLMVQDKSGKVVTLLMKDTLQDSGAGKVIWNGKDSLENFVPEGVYDVVIKAIDKFQKDSGPLTETITVGYEPGIQDVKLNPSPFYASGSNGTTISFILTEEAVVTVEIKVQWVTVKTLISESLEKPGVKTIRWNGSDNSGYLVGEGLYDIQITAVSPTVSSFRTKFSGSFDVKEANS